MKSRLDIFRNAYYAKIMVSMLTALLLFTSCASLQEAYHKHIMRGSIVEVEGNEIYLCVGEKDGAKIGQELDVYHIKVMRSEGKISHRLRREKVGRVRITALVDEHFANALIISGEAQKNDIVELETAVK